MSLIISSLVALVAIIGLALNHRRDVIELRRLTHPSTPERDAGFDEGLERAAEVAGEIDCELSNERRVQVNIVAAIRGARR